MNTEEQIKDATSLQEAMNIIARALDALWEEIQELKGQEPESDWGPWNMQETTEALRAENKRTQSKIAAKHILAQLAEAEEQLSDAIGEERQALEARVSLLKDQLREETTVAPAEYGTRSVLEVDDEGNTVVNLPPVSEKIKRVRLNFAEQIDGVDPELYAKGGPLWLYYGDRDLVMQLPDDWKREMVNDVQETSPSEAHEFARDVLKDSGPGVSSEYVEEVTAQVDG